MEKKKIRLGVVGSEHVHGPWVYRCVLEHPDVFEVVGFDDVRKTPVEPLYEPFLKVPQIPLDDMLADPTVDAMLIESAEWDNLAIAEKVAAAGKPFHMDKPAGYDCKQFERILSTMKKKNLPISMGYMYRSNYCVRYMLDAVRSGRLGEVYEVNTRMSIDHNAFDHKLLASYPGGIMYFLVCHLIDLTLSVMGVPDDITAFINSHEKHGSVSPDDATVVMHYARGTSVAKACSLEVGGFTRRECSVMGTNGTIEIKPMEEPSLLRETYRDYSVQHGAPLWHEVHLPQYRNRYEIMMLDFADMVRGDLVSPYSYEHEARLHRMLMYACGDKSVDWKGKIVL